MKSEKSNMILVEKAKGLKSKEVEGIIVPGDKSISHRALMLASIADGDTAIDGLLWGDDCISTLKAFAQMGIQIDIFTDDNFLRKKLSNVSSNIKIYSGVTFPGRVCVHGKGLHKLEEPDDVIDAGNSGTTTRLLTGLLAGQKDFYAVITGDRYLRVRPMKRVIEPLSKMGSTIWGREGDTKAPISIKGSKLKGITYNSPIASAQVKSAILLAGLYADGVTTVTEPTLSRDHTERMLKYFGAEVMQNGTTVNIKGGQTLAGITKRGLDPLDIPGDISSAAFLIVAALITEDSKLLVKDVGINPTRTGIIDILKAMGGNIELLNKREVSGELVGDILVKSSKLEGIEIKGDVIPRAIDELPVLAVAAAFAEGVTKIRDAKELRVKESDRIGTMAANLRRLGILVTEFEDGMDVVGGEPIISSEPAFDSFGDHRIAMAMYVAGLAVKGNNMFILGHECIDTSFPGFKELIKKVSVQ